MGEFPPIQKKLLFPHTDISTPLQREALEEFSRLGLSDRLDRVLDADPERYNPATVIRVRQLIQYETENPGKLKPYRMLRSVDDFAFYYRLHPEWYGKKPSVLCSDKDGASGFYGAVNNFIRNISENKAERFSLRRSIFTGSIDLLRSKDKSELIRAEALRDGAGRVRWSLPGNTQEEDEQLGVNNIQALFVTAFPEFDTLFPRDENGQIREEDMQKAKEFIEKHIGKIKDFIIIFGNSPKNSIAAPYFQGSHLTAIKKSFSDWGVKFEKIIANKNEWMSLYGISIEFEVSGGVLPSLLKEITYIDGRNSRNHLTRLYKREEVVRQIEYYKSLPRLTLETGHCIIPDKGIFVNLTRFAKEKEIDPATLNKYIKGFNTLSSQLVVGNNGHIINVYEEGQLKQTITSFTALPQVGDDVRITFQGRQMVCIQYILGEYDVSPGIQRRLDKSVKSIIARNRRRKVTFYDEEEVIRELGDYQILPRVDLKTKVYTDTYGTWVALGTLAKLWTMDWDVLLKAANNISYIEGRDWSNRKTKLYNMGAMAQALNKDTIYIPSEEAWKVIDMFFDS